MLLLGCLVLLTVTARCTAAPADTEATCSVTRSDLIQFLPFKKVFQLDEVVESFCLEGYTLKGAKTSRCSSNGWEPALPTCEAVRCRVQDNLLVSDRKEYANGEVARFSCGKGYRLVGQNILRCFNNGWSLAMPHCEEKQRCGNPRGIENGEITEDTLKAEYVTGDIVKYSCNPGYSLSGSNENKCTGGTWLAPPHCTANPCGVPPGVDNGRVIGTNTYYNHGESAKYTCNKGYKLTEEIPAKCLKGDWTNVPECVSTSCPPPPSIANGRLIPNSRANSKGEYASGDKVQYTCNNGYNLEKKNNEATCEETEWKSVPVCRRTGASCSTPPTVQFGDHLGPNQPNYRSGFQIKYKCPSYFKLVGKEMVKCEDGVWDEPPVCLEPCTASEKEMTKNNIVFRWINANKLYTEHDQPVVFICMEGYEITEGSILRVRCNKGVIPYPKCNKKGSCLLSEETMKQQNIYLNINSAIQDGEKVLFECNKGFVPENTLEGTCKMRILNYPKCIISQKCKFLPDVPNGRVKVEELKEDGYDSGSSVEFECDENHRLSGPINVKCETGQWSDLPQCLKPCRISLEELSTNNVELKSQDDVNKVFKDSETVYVKCKTGYRNPTLGIDAKGECYNGKMRYSRCFQKSFCRIDQDNIDGNNLELDAKHNDEGYYGDEEDVHFICKKGFHSMTGSLTGKCEKTILRYPRCIPEQSCPIEKEKLEENNLQLNDNQKDRFYLEAGESVAFICKQGFRIISPRLLQRKCEKQTLTYPRCTKEISV